MSVTVDSLVEMTCREIARLTDTHESQWSYYDNGQPINERTLVGYAELLELPPWDVLRMMNLRRLRKNTTVLKPRRRPTSKRAHKTYSIAS